ncbi:hypothetical protein L249_6396, partial [Ophiocordyceps polyrhachis-furcata BCC 54312]
TRDLHLGHFRLSRRHVQPAFASHMPKAVTELTRESQPVRQFPKRNKNAIKKNTFVWLSSRQYIHDLCRRDVVPFTMA